jgi:hypothetical protein
MTNSILVVGITLPSVVLLFLIAKFKKKSTNMLVAFYSACDDMRDRIHKATSSAEIKEIMNDIIDIEDTFVPEIPVPVADKELKLLHRLLEKKSKKIK